MENGEGDSDTRAARPPALNKFSALNSLDEKKGGEGRDRDKGGKRCVPWLEKFLITVETGATPIAEVD
jgi:hypothetical protein